MLHLCRSYPCPGCVASGVDRYMIAFFSSILPFSVRVLDQLDVRSDHFAVCPCILVRRLRTRFGKNGYTPDKSTNFFLHHHSFHFGRGATSSGRQKAAILDFQYGRHVKSISANISAWKALRRSILVSKYTFSESRNAL